MEPYIIITLLKFFIEFWVKNTYWIKKIKIKNIEVFLIS